MDQARLYLPSLRAIDYDASQRLMGVVEEAGRWQLVEIATLLTAPLAPAPTRE